MTGKADNIDVLSWSLEYAKNDQGGNGVTLNIKASYYWNGIYFADDHNILKKLELKFFKLKNKEVIIFTNGVLPPSKHVIKEMPKIFNTQMPKLISLINLYKVKVSLVSNKLEKSIEFSKNSNTQP